MNQSKVLVVNKIKGNINRESTLT